MIKLLIQEKWLGQNKFNRYKNNKKKEISIPDIIKKDLETLMHIIFLMEEIQ